MRLRSKLENFLTGYVFRSMSERALSDRFKATYHWSHLFQRTLTIGGGTWKHHCMADLRFGFHQSSKADANST